VRNRSSNIHFGEWTACYVSDALEGDQRMEILFERAKQQRLIEEV
jgi:hypothetical protein